MEAVPSTQPAPIRARLLGQIEIAIGDRVVADEDWPPRGARTLFLLLLISPRFGLPRERVLDLLWPESSPEAAANALYKALHALRRVLEPELKTGRGSAYIATDNDLIRIKPHDGLWVDVAAFESGLAQAATQPPSERRKLLREALSLYGGDLLADELYADWPVARREALRQARERATLDLASLDLEAGEPLEAIPALEALLASDPALETGHQALIRIFAASGQPDRARRQYARLQRTLSEELGVEPSATTEALMAAVEAATPPPVTLPVGSGRPVRFDNLPVPLTPLVGRRREVESVQDLLWRPEVRLVTLLGPGGIGKTRLALEAATGLASEFSAGAAFVNLAPVQDPGLVLPAITQALGIREEGDRPLRAMLRDLLQDREALLVLDNVEQVVDAGPVVVELLADCPGLKLLATSRERLHLRGEQTYEVPPLSLPRVRRGGEEARRREVGSSRLAFSPARLLASEAVSLFVQTAQGVVHGFEVTAENAETVAAICVRLEGIPLAIELAASRLRHLSPAALLAQLDHRLEALTGGPRDLPARQRTLRDTIAWSYDLLSADEQRLFRRLGVFSGGSTVEAAETVSRGSETTRRRGGQSELLDSLVDKSLLRLAESDGGQRIEMLESVREFGLETLEDAGEAGEIWLAHARYFADLAEEGAVELYGATQAEWFDRLDADNDNFQVALGWSLGNGEVETALRIAGALARFWYIRGHLTDGTEWLNRALAADDAAGGPQTVARARALHGLGLMDFTRADYTEAVPHYEAALAIWTALDDKQGAAATLNNLALCAQEQGELGRAIELHKESLRLAEEAGERFGVARSLNGLGNVALYQQRLEEAEEYFNQALTILRELDDRHSMAMAIGNLGLIAYHRGDYPRALERAAEAQRIKRELGDAVGLAYATVNFAAVALAQGNLAKAQQLYEEALRQAEDTGLARLVAMSTFSLGEVAFKTGHRDDALRLYGEAFSEFQTMHDQLAVLECLDAFARVAAQDGDLERSAHLLAVAAREREGLGVALGQQQQVEHDRLLVELKAALGDDRFAALWEAARDLQIAEVAGDLRGAPAGV